MKEYIRDVYHDELRGSFLVIFDRKKVWNVELHLVAEFERICKKFGLRYFMTGKTLLGAVRHQGFIPWEDDICLMMPRPNYDRLKKVIDGELSEGLFFQDIYTDDGFSMSCSRLRDSRTTAIGDHENKVMNQGIYITIEALDDASDGSADEDAVLAMEKELWLAVAEPDVLRGMPERVLPIDMVEGLLALSRAERMRQFESVAAERFGTSRFVGRLQDAFEKRQHWQRIWFDSLVLLPFETMQLPAPVMYDSLLTACYGDYHTFEVPLRAETNILYSADIPYTECLEKVDF